MLCDQTAFAQSDLNLPWMYISKGTLSDVVAHDILLTTGYIQSTDLLPRFYAMMIN